MSDIQTTLLQVENLLKAINQSGKLSFEQSYALRKLSVELNKLAIVK